MERGSEVCWERMGMNPAPPDTTYVACGAALGAVAHAVQLVARSAASVTLGPTEMTCGELCAFRRVRIGGLDRPAARSEDVVTVSDLRGRRMRFRATVVCFDKVIKTVHPTWDSQSLGWTDHTPAIALGDLVDAEGMRISGSAWVTHTDALRMLGLRVGNVVEFSAKVGPIRHDDATPDGHQLMAPTEIVLVRPRQNRSAITGERDETDG